MHPLDSDLYIDEAAAALANTNVFVSREVNGADALTESLVQQVGDASIGVAVFSENASLEAAPTEILAELEDATEFDSIIVVVGDDLLAGSDVLPSDEALRIANEAQETAASTDAALTQTIEQVIAATPDSPAGSADAGPFIGIALGVVVLLAAGGAVFGIVRSRSRRRNRPAAGRHAPLPEPVRTHVQTLQALTADYARAGSAGIAQAGEVAAQVGLIAQNTTELFERLDRKGEEGQRPIAAVEYGETLRKLTGALDRDYLLDILTHPDLWDDPVERVREVRTALSSFSTELVENIKQVNARRGLHFQVSLDGLMGRRKELQDWDRAFERADGDAGPVPRGD